MKKILIDLNVFTAAEWDKNKEAIEFLKKAKNYEVYEPLFFVYHIARRWEYRKLADKIVKMIDELKSRIMLFSELDEKIKAKCKLSLKELTIKAIKKLKMKTEDFWLVLFASVNNALLVTYNRKDLKDKEREINDFLTENNLDAIEIKLPSELLSSNPKLSLNPSSNVSLPPFSYFKTRNLFSHNFSLNFNLFKAFSLFLQRYASNQISTRSPSKFSSDDYRINRAKSFSHFFNVFKISSIMFFLFILLLPLVKASVVLNATDFISFNISSSEIARIITGGLVVSAGWVNSTNAAFNQICLSGNCKTFWPSSNLVGGTGTVNYIPIWTASDTLGISPFYLTSNNLNLGLQSLINASWINASYLNISAGLVVLPNGNVGIGTTAPSQKLHVSGGFSLLNDVASTINRNYGVLLWTDRAFGMDLGYSNANTWSTRIFTRSGDGDIVFSKVPSSGADYQANFTDLMIIKNNGNVGIGTTSPTQKLEVVGNIHTNTGNIRAFGPNNQGVLLEPGTNDASYSDLVFYNGGYRPGRIDASTLILQTRSGGNVGIGTTSPGERLELASGGNIKLNIFPADDTTPGLVSIRFDSRDTGGTTHTWRIYTAPIGGGYGVAPNSIEFWEYPPGGGTLRRFVILKNTTASPSVVAIDGAGNVGIGTTSPSSKLEVYGGNIEINDGSPTGTYKIVGKKNFYAGDETQVSSTSTTYELKKQFTSVFSSDYGIKPSYVNIIARIWNGAAGNTTYLNVTLEGCNGIILSATSTSATLVKGSISVSSCFDGLYTTKIYLSTTSGGTAYNDLIEFYYVE